MRPIDYLLWYGSIYSAAIPLLFTWKKLNRYQGIIVIFICLSFATDLLARYVIQGRNYFFLHGYGFLEAAVLLYFYGLVIENGKKTIRVVTIAYLVFYVVNSLYWERDIFNTYGRSVECLVMISLAITVFYEFYSREEDIFIDRSPLFWFNVAILTYFSGAFFSFILSREILSGPMPWLLHNASNIMKNLLLAVGLWRIPAK